MRVNAHINTHLHLPVLPACRYNQAVQPPGITILSQLPAQSANAAVPHLTGPDCFPSILFDVSMGLALHSGSLFVRNKQAALEKQQSSAARLISSSGAASSSGGSVSGAAVLQVPATSEDRLAAWLGVDLAAAEQLLSVQRVRALKAADWKAKLSAAADLLDAVGHLTSGSSGSSSSDSSSGQQQRVLYVSSKPQQ